MYTVEYLFNLQPEIRQSSINVGNKQLWQIRKRETNSEEEGSSKQIPCLIAYLFDFGSSACAGRRDVDGTNQNWKAEVRETRDRKEFALQTRIYTTRFYFNLLFMRDNHAVGFNRFKESTRDILKRPSSSSIMDSDGFISFMQIPLNFYAQNRISSC